jgi:hypothetical protein
VDWILHNTLVEVLLCIEAATGLAVDCRSGDTYYRCCFVTTTHVYFVEEVVVVGIAAAEALALRARVPVGEGVLLRAATLLELLFLV